MAKLADPDDSDLQEGFERTRMSLIDRLSDWEDQRTWDEFYRTYWRLIFSVSMKGGLSRDESLDVVQETVLSIAKQWKKGQTYDPAKGSFKSWLMNVTRWRIADQYRKKQRNPAASNQGGAFADFDNTRDTATIERIEDPHGETLEQIWEIEWKENLSKVALDRVKLKVSPKQYQIFDAYVLQGWGVDRVRDELGISSAQVYLAKHRVGGLVKKEIEAIRESHL